ncbi:MAG: hypothetical protein ACI9P9_000674, partial [Patescibacteria group bacterium]
EKGPVHNTVDMISASTRSAPSHPQPLADSKKKPQKNYQKRIVSAIAHTILFYSEQNQII